MKNYAFIFARGGSKRIKNKNLKLINSKPLIYYSINLASNIKFIDKTFISTDSKNIINYACKFKNTHIIKRPKKLATDASDEWLSWKHAVKYVNSKFGDFKYFLSLPTTSPLREKKDIIKCLKLIKNRKHDIVLTTTETERKPGYNMVYKFNDKIKIIETKKQLNKKKIFDLTTVAYLCESKYIISKNGIFDGRVGAVEVPKSRSLDIDTIDDFKYAEYLMKIKK